MSLLGAPASPSVAGEGRALDQCGQCGPGRVSQAHTRWRRWGWGREAWPVCFRVGARPARCPTRQFPESAVTAHASPGLAFKVCLAGFWLLPSPVQEGLVARGLGRCRWPQGTSDLLSPPSLGSAWLWPGLGPGGLSPLCRQAPLQPSGAAALPWEDAGGLVSRARMSHRAVTGR